MSSGPLCGMWLPTTRRRNSDRSQVRYLSLAHNEWDRVAGCSKVRILFNSGREDGLDPDAIRRLIGSLSRALPPDEALTAATAPELRFLESRPLGGASLLDGLWSRLGLREILVGLLHGRRLDPSAERVLFAMVANRALDPLSKLGCAAWVTEKAVIPGLAELDDDQCYRAMDWLLQIEAELAERVYWSVANLLNLEVDLLFFEATSTYFETDQADPPSEGAPAGFRTYSGHSKDHRSDLPEVVIGLAVTRTGIPIRVWTLPGNASDQELLRRVKDDLRAWKLGRVVWVTDRGPESAENRRYLQRAGGHYITGEKLRGDSARTRPARRGAISPGSSRRCTSGASSARQATSVSGPRRRAVRPRSSRPRASPSRPASSAWRRQKPPSRAPDRQPGPSPGPETPAAGRCRIGTSVSSSCGIPACERRRIPGSGPRRSLEASAKCRPPLPCGVR